MFDGESCFLSACSGERGSSTPVWFMRQAGRSLPEYRALRGSGSILDAIRQPELATEITLQPVRRYGVDAAILFSDIVVPLLAIGVGLEIVPGRGPVIDEPFRTKSDLKRLRPLEPETDLSYVLSTIRELVTQLSVPLIGFAGAPFTVASYLVEGGPSRTFAKTKALMHSDEPTWHALMESLAKLAASALRAQIEAGVSAVQLFDSWAGALSRVEYERFVLPYSTEVFEAIRPLGVPGIHFGVGTGELLDLMARTGSTVIGVDWRVALDEAARRVPGRVLQGNLDPAICLAPLPVVTKEVERVLFEARAAPAHVFNLGHGVLPETDPGVLEAIVELVHQERER